MVVYERLRLRPVHTAVFSFCGGVVMKVTVILRDVCHEITIDDQPSGGLIKSNKVDEVTCQTAQLSTSMVQGYQPTTQKL